MHNYLKRFVVFILLYLSAPFLKAQTRAFIYGQVSMKNGDSFTGFIRWSNNQVLWTDLLLIAKMDNPLLKYLSSEQLENLSEGKNSKGVDWEFMNLWKTKYPSRVNSFKCCFGDIASLKASSGSQAVITFKNGDELRVKRDGDYDKNLGRDLTVFDPKKGEIKIEWDKMDKVRFMDVPANLMVKVTALYGTVMTSNGPITGFIQWDKSKGLTYQKISGKTSNGKNQSFSFNDLISIEKKDNGVIVRPKENEEIFLKDNRDVNNSNRGIVILDPLMGRTTVDWKAFRSVIFSSCPEDKHDYKSYSKPQLLHGTIRTRDNKIYKGNFVFDLDEALNLEILDGAAKNGIYYQIPFRNVSKITPRTAYYSEVKLNNNVMLYLGGEFDVTEGNWGIMLWLPDSKYKYLSWDKISEISF